MQFRQQALAKLQSPEELDLPVRFARPQGWLVLAVTVVVMAAASVWAVTGSVSSTLERTRHPHARAGQLRPAEPRLRPGHRGARRGGRAGSPPNAPVLKVRTAKGEHGRTHASPRAGSPPSPPRSAPSSPPARTSPPWRRSPTPTTRWWRRCTCRPRTPPRSPSGAAVDLTVQSAPTQQYGVLRGRVKAVGRAAQTRAADHRLPRQQPAGRAVLPGGPGRWPCWCGSTARPAPKSGYRWSSDGRARRTGSTP